MSLSVFNPNPVQAYRYYNEHDPLKRNLSILRLYYIYVAVTGAPNDVVYSNRPPCLPTQALGNWSRCFLPITLSTREIFVCTPLLPGSRA